MSNTPLPPFSMDVSDADFSSANRWWRSLSINQMKAFESKYFPGLGVVSGRRWVHQMWEAEGKPAPQQTIPV